MTTARFALEVINAEYEAIKNIADNNPVILIGFSGGAQVAGLVATAKPGLNVKNYNHCRKSRPLGMDAISQSAAA